MQRQDEVRQYAEHQQLHAEEDARRGDDRDDLVRDRANDPVVGDVQGETDSGRGRRESDAAEVEQRVVGLGAAVQFEKDDTAVADRFEVRVRAVGPRVVGGGDDRRLDAAFRALDGHLRLDAKAIGGERHVEERLASERPVATEDVAEVLTVNERERPVDDAVSDPVESRHRTRPHVGEAVTDDVLVPLGERVKHLGGVRRFVGAVAVEHQDVCRFDVVLDGFSDCLTFARPGLDDDVCASLFCELPRSVRRPTVDDEHVGVSLVSIVGDDIGDCFRLVVGGDEDTDGVGGGHCYCGGGGLLKRVFSLLSRTRLRCTPERFTGNSRRKPRPSGRHQNASRSGCPPDVIWRRG